MKAFTEKTGRAPAPTVCRAALTLLAAALLCGGCARSTSLGDDGQILLVLELDPAKVKATVGLPVGELGFVSHVLRITYRVGTDEPVTYLVTWDESSAARLRDGGYGPELRQVPVEREFDLTGALVPGGTEVSVDIVDQMRSARRVFVVNGNVRLRLRMLDPNLPGEQSNWVFERLL